MAEISPFVEANYGWPYGSSGWNTDMDANLVKFSYLFDRNIDGIVATLPAISNGTAYFLTTDNRLYFDADGQRYSSPTPKWFIVTLKSSGQTYQFDGAALVQTDSPQQVVDSLTAPDGSTLLGFQATGTGSVPLTVFQKISERVSITDKGAIGDGVTNCAQAILDAASSTIWDIYVPTGSFVATVTSVNAAAIFEALSRIKVDGELVLNIASGTTNLSTQVVINSPDAHKISIVGATPVATTATSQVSVGGSAKAYSVIIGVASSAGVSIGDYALIRTDVTGTGDYYAHAGVWKVTAVDSGGANRLTLLNTHHGAAFPTNTLTGGTISILKTIIKFTGSDGFRFEGGQPIGLIDQVAIVGDWDLSTATGTTGAHGIIMSSPVITGAGSSNATFNFAGNAALGPNVGISAFGEQGIAISGRCGLVANFVASCSNRKRGWYAEGGHIRAKLGVASGNGEDGYISDTTGFIQAALCIASGNGLNGFWSTNNGTIAAATSIASGNLSNGYECRGVGRLGADLATSLNNTSSGFSASDGGMIDADSAIATGNGSHGFDAGSGAVIDCDNSTSTGNTGYGFRSQYGSVVRAAGSIVSGNTIGNYLATNASILFESGGSVSVLDTPTYSVTQRVYDSTKATYYGFSTSSIGDLVFSATTTARFSMKADGTFHPTADNSAICGRSTNRWASVFGRQLFVGGGTQLISGGAGTPEGVVTAPVGSLWLRSDGGAITTLYIKETGAGNTGWVAK